MLKQNHIRNITVGIDQLKREKSYTQEQFSISGSHELFIYKTEEALFRTRLQWTHVFF